MKTTLGAMFALLILFACTGIHARQDVLMPAMRDAWRGISSDIDLGLTEVPPEFRAPLEIASAEMGLALDSGDRVRVVRIDWPTLRHVAERGVAKRQFLGLVGPGVAGSLRERIVNFDEAFRKLGER